MRRPGFPGGVALALPIAALAAYWPALRGALVWDDDAHVTRPDLRSLHGLWRIWSEPGATQQYYPVLHSAFWAEHRLWGDSALGYHLVNVLLHLGAVLLLYRVLRRLSVAGALLGASMFALHPVCVETVAWISEQKNTLSTVLCLAAALAYLRFDGDRRRRWYALGTGLFCLALLAKSVTATLPAALLVVLWWKRGRLSWKGDVLPLAPWFCMSAAAAAMTAWVEHTFVGARGASFGLGSVERILVAGRAVWFYLGKLVWPADLVFIYPRWTIDARVGWQYLFPAAAVAALAALYAVRGRSRGPLAAALLFAGTLFPALGFINVYPFVFSFVADHFQYLAAAGMIPALAAGVALAADRLPPVGRAASRVAALCVLCVLAGLTWRQCGQYRDLETFYRAILERNPTSWLAHDNLGVVLVRRGQAEEAAGHYREAMRLNPDYPEAYNNYGNVLAQAGRWIEAADAYAGALRARPWFAAAEKNWGKAMSDAGRLNEAELHFRNAIRIQPEYADAHYGLANALANSGRLPEAVAEYGETLRLQPDLAEAHANLGLALAEQGLWSEALPQIAEAVRIRPGYAEAHAYCGYALAGAGRLTEAVDEYREALRVGPDNPDVHYQIGVALRKLGRIDEAKAEFDAAGRLSVPAK
jgi:tetratricopeptide (TPR) repeat protein